MYVYIHIYDENNKLGYNTKFHIFDGKHLNKIREIQ